jgi:hypothetical protein
MSKFAFEAPEINQEQFEALHNDVLVSDMPFDARVLGTGIILLNDNGTSLGIRPRWGRVYAVGPEQQDVRVGEFVMVAHGRWTRGLKIKDETGERTIRKVDPKDILMIADDTDVMPEDESFSEALHIAKKTRE